MTPSTLCIARSSVDRTIGSESAQACLHGCHNAFLMVRSTVLRFVLSWPSAANRYFFLRERWRAAQLEVAPDKTPDAAPAGRAGSFCARRTASRRLQTRSGRSFRSSRQAARRSSARAWMRLAGEPLIRWTDVDPAGLTFPPPTRDARGIARELQGCVSATSFFYAG